MMAISNWQTSDSQNNVPTKHIHYAAPRSRPPLRSSWTKGTASPWTGGRSASSFRKCCTASTRSTPTTLWKSKPTSSSARSSSRAHSPPTPSHSSNIYWPPTWARGTAIWTTGRLMLKIIGGTVIWVGMNW